MEDFNISVSNILFTKKKNILFTKYLIFLKLYLRVSQIIELNFQCFNVNLINIFIYKISKSYNIKALSYVYPRLWVNISLAINLLTVLSIYMSFLNLFSKGDKLDPRFWLWWNFKPTVTWVWSSTTWLYIIDTSNFF